MDDFRIRPTEEIARQAAVEAVLALGVKAPPFVETEHPRLHGKFVSKVEGVAFHRNGVGGAGFHMVNFQHKAEGKTHHMTGVVFDEPGHVAVYDRKRAAAGGIGSASAEASNAWRGDEFEPELRAAIKDHQNAQDEHDKTISKLAGLHRQLGAARSHQERLDRGQAPSDTVSHLSRLASNSLAQEHGQHTEYVHGVARDIQHHVARLRSLKPHIERIQGSV